MVAEADARMRDHVAAASNDMAGAMGAIDAALKATIEAAHVRLTESQRDTRAFKAAMDAAHTEILGVQVSVQALQVKAMEAERALRDLMQRGQCTGGGSQTDFFDMSSPARGTSSQPQWI